MQRLGAGRGLLHALRAEPLDAEEALRAGLVDAVAREGETLEECLDRFLEPILERPPQVLRGYKAVALAERRGESQERRQEIQENAFVRTWTHPDHWEAVERRSTRKA
jgi:enoyl-CoA hydratase/carnithine racemase